MAKTKKVKITGDKKESLSPMDKIITDAAATYMLRFDLAEFKQTHRRLYITIKQSMQDHAAAEVQKIINHQKTL